MVDFVALPGVQSLVGTSDADTFTFPFGSLDLGDTVDGGGGDDTLVIAADQTISFVGLGGSFTSIEQLKLSGDSWVDFSLDQLDGGAGSLATDLHVISGETETSTYNLIRFSMTAGATVSLADWTFTDWDVNRDSITIFDTVGGNETITGSSVLDSIIVSGGQDFVDLGGPLGGVLTIDYSYVGSTVTRTGNTFAVSGGGSQVTFTGDAQLDVRTGAGNDNFFTGSQTDTLSPGAGSDVVRAGDGNDYFVGYDEDNDVYDGEGSYDSVEYTGAIDAVVIDLSEIDRSSNATVSQMLTAAGYAANKAVGIAQHGSAIDILIGFELVHGGQAGDQIAGNAMGNYIDGLDGNDTLEGRGSNDALDGGADIDTAVYSGAWVDYQLAFAGGSAFVVHDERPLAPDGSDNLTNVELFKFSNGTFTASEALNDAPTNIALTGNSIAENSAIGTVVGTLSRTDADIGLGDTATYYLPGVSTFSIEGDKLIVGDQLDFEASGSHTLIVFVYDANAAFFQKEFTINVTNVNEPPAVTTVSPKSVAEGQTLVTALAATDPEGATPTFSIAAISGTDHALFEIVGGNLRFKAARDYETQAHHYQVTVKASDGVNTTAKSIMVNLTNVSPEEVNGTPADDRLTGGFDRDIIAGGDGRDTMNGAENDDVLRGGLGADTMRGAAGRDRFDFDAVAEIGKKKGLLDVIADFGSGDKIDLSSIDANGAKTGDAPFKFLKKEGAALTKAGQVGFDQKKGVTYVQGDTNGDGKADFKLEVIGKIDFAKADFVL